MFALVDSNTGPNTVSTPSPGPSVCTVIAEAAGCTTNSQMPPTYASIAVMSVLYLIVPSAVPGCLTPTKSGLCADVPLGNINPALVPITTLP